jgi:GMP synthase-like glutamine amidotransferase
VNGVRALPRVLVVEHEDDAGLGRLLPHLDAELDGRRPDRGDLLPTDLGGYDGLIVLGGSMAAGEDDVAAWLPATRRLLAAGVEQGLPTLGICLGAQLLAVATGGRVERGGHGLEVGMTEIRLLDDAAADRLLGPVRTAFGPRVAVPQWHQDAVTRLPAGAVLLATGELYPNQAFRLGPRAWGLQYHPEVTADAFAAWLLDGHGAIRAGGLHPDEVAAGLARTEHHQELVARPSCRG